MPKNRYRLQFLYRKRVRVGLQPRSTFAIIRNQRFNLFPVLVRVIVFHEVTKLVDNDVIDDSVWGHDDPPVVGYVS